MRQEFCTKDGISITYNEDNIGFEDTKTAEGIVIANDGSIVMNNFDKDKTDYFMKYFKRIFKTVTYLRSVDRLEAV